MQLMYSFVLFIRPKINNFQNEYLRMATLNVLSTLDAKLNVADILCRVMPLVEPYLKEKLIKLRNKVL